MAVAAGGGAEARPPVRAHHGRLLGALRVAVRAASALSHTTQHFSQLAAPLRITTCHHTEAYLVACGSHEEVAVRVLIARLHRAESLVFNRGLGPQKGLRLLKLLHSDGIHDIITGISTERPSDSAIYLERTTAHAAHLKRSSWGPAAHHRRARLSVVVETGRKGLELLSRRLSSITAVSFSRSEATATLGRLVAAYATYYYTSCPSEERPVGVSRLYQLQPRARSRDPALENLSQRQALSTEFRSPYQITTTLPLCTPREIHERWCSSGQPPLPPSCATSVLLEVDNRCLLCTFGTFRKE